MFMPFADRLNPQPIADIGMLQRKSYVTQTEKPSTDIIQTYNIQYWVSIQLAL